jgi:energy-coupling factor transporter ATP-binding protein EcfA2
MIRSITLTDYQSHQSTHLSFGPFTVIVGSSSSGKSAVVRALRLAAENARGVSYVRQGAQRCRVALEISGPADTLNGSTVVTVERGKGVSAYTLAVAGAHERPVEFTKCGSGVPDAVAEALGLGDSSLWVAGQFDSPYLLDDTGSEVARVLGKLTNVNMIYSAVRESNRRASEAKRIFTMKNADLDKAKTDLHQYVTLAARKAAGRTAEEALSRSEALSSTFSQLSERTVGVRDARQRATQARSSLRVVPDVSRLTRLHTGRTRLVGRLAELSEVRGRRAGASVGLRTVPDTKSFDSIISRRARLREEIGLVTQASAAKSRLNVSLVAARSRAELARKAFMDALSRAGNCPLCGASSDHAHVGNVL